jgi:hypothetical protein
MTDRMTRAVIRQRLERSVHRSLLSVPDLAVSERSADFELLRMNRKIMGAFRYGSMQENRTKRHRNVEAAIQRLSLYLRDGNQEHLLDAANLCEIEWVNPGSHRNPHFSPVDDGPHKVVES